jgi:hypothetical protein
VGRLSLGGGDDVEVGRLSLKVSRDPLLFDAEPWNAWAERPAEAQVR